MKIFTFYQLCYHLPPELFYVNGINLIFSSFVFFLLGRIDRREVDFYSLAFYILSLRSELSTSDQCQSSSSSIICIHLIQRPCFLLFVARFEAWCSEEYA